MQTDTLVKLINHAEDMLQLDADREVVEYEEEEGLINANDYMVSMREIGQSWTFHKEEIVELENRYMDIEERTGRLAQICQSRGLRKPSWERPLVRRVAELRAAYQTVRPP